MNLHFSSDESRTEVHCIHIDDVDGDDAGCYDYRVKTMQATLQQRSTVLQQIANKLCGDLDETTAGMQSNAAVDLPGAPVQRGHWRARAFKPIGRERLKSTVV